MAKSKSSDRSKKSSSGANAARLKPADFIKQKARTLPIGDCYLGSDPDNPGRTTAVVTRIRPSGNIAACYFMIDKNCFGVTDAFCRVNMTPDNWKDELEESTSLYHLKPASYAEIHNLIFGAIEFAEEAGLEPASTFDIAEYMLDDDSDESIPLMTFDFGRNGKHYVEISQYTPEAMGVVEGLKEKLGDKFEFKITDPKAPWSIRNKPTQPVFPIEPFSYDYPRYPAEPTVKHPFIAETFLDPANYFSIPADTTANILALPPDEAAADIAAVMLYATGRTYRQIADGSDDSSPNSAIMHSLIHLTAIKSDKALDALTDLAHQSFDFIEAHLGDYATELVPEALMTASGDNIGSITRIIDSPGLDAFNRFYAFKALALKYKHQPELRDKIKEALRAHLERLAANLPATRACSAEYAGLIMGLFDDMQLSELLPEIKTVYDTGFVDTSICGDYTTIAANMTKPVNDGELTTSSIEEYYSQLKRSQDIAESR